MLTLLPVLTNWLANSYEVTVQDLVLPLILAFLTSTIIAFIFLKDYKKNKLSAWIGAILAVLIIGFGYDSRYGQVNFIFNALNPIPELSNDQKKILFSLEFVLLILLTAKSLTFYLRKIFEAKKWKTGDFATGILIAITVAFLFKFVPTTQTIVTEWPQFFYRPPALNVSLKANPNNKPDIYYIVMDRYASQSVLTDQLHFDNSDFINYLESNNFTTNPQGHNNYPYTTMSIASTLNASYLSDLATKFSGVSDQTIEPYHDAVRYSSVIRKLKSLGYTYDEVGSWYETTNQAPLADNYYQPEGQLTILNQRITLNNFSKNYLAESVWWQFVTFGLKFGHFQIATYSASSGPSSEIYKINELKDIAAEPSGAKFVFAHILVPHDPYYFNSDGSLSDNPSTDNQGKLVTQKYTSQIQFMNSQMKNVISEIQKNSGGNAVIILQSDEGPYPLELNDQQFDINQLNGELAGNDMTKWSENDLLMKYGNLDAYSVPKAAKTDLAAGGDPVNIFRLIFNTYFEAKMPYLPLCYWAYSNGRSQPFVYTGINKQITGQDNPACPSDDIFK